ncbi:MAG: hypothetical protein JWO73_579 [Candidatus Taylorbacteria bacterium]|nr:hypothetical protein [Candidatus Taylorbacteria bacterium]
MKNHQSESSSNAAHAIIAIVILLGGGYYLYSTKGASAATSANSNLETTVAGGGDADSAAIGADVLALLGQINSLKIDSNFFVGSSSLSSAYQSLVDFSQPIPIENVGRPNPFTQVSGMNQASVPTAKK